ncbi:MAG: DUF3105 domain-containing protein, partial [Polyangiaceae bacterium]
MLARTWTMVLVVAGGAALGAATACGSSGSGTGGAGGTATAGTGAGGPGGAGGEEEGLGGEASWEIGSGSGGCNAVLYEPPVLSSPHVDACSDLDHLSNPPTSGPHYGSWAQFKNYDEPVPRGFLIHAMEHGAVLFLYNCTNCDDEITAIQDYIASKPTDPACLPTVDR